MFVSKTFVKAVRKSYKPVFILLLSLLAVACTTSSAVRPVGEDGKAKTVRLGSAVTLIPMDIELSLLTASGLQEPRAEWTQAAQRFMDAEIQRVLNNADYKLSKLDFDGAPAGSDFAQIQKLNETVGFTIALHHFRGVPLPSKNGRLDWSVGEYAKLLKAEEDARYALYIYFRDSYSSGARVAVQVLATALLGFVPSGGQQVAFANLVDTETGDVVWYKYLVSGTGDARSEKGAKATVERLLRGFPGVIDYPEL